MTREYELTVVFAPTLKEEGLKSAVKAVDALVVKTGGKVASVSEVDKQPLAYPIGKFHEGIYVLWNLELSSEKTVKFEADLKLLKGVIRQLLIRSQ